jgi:L-threonylcarbamoyladenylate synthase
MTMDTSSLNATIRCAAAIIRRGGLVVFPTHGLYGLGADALDPDAVRRVFEAKGRSGAKPLSALISSLEMLDLLAQAVSPLARRLMQRLWPGKVTFVVPARQGLPPGMCSNLGRIGVRWVAHPVAAALVSAVGGPVTGTSANLSGQPGCAAVQHIPAEILDKVDLVLDAGELAGGPGSTVVDVTGPDPRILRQGALAADKITAALKD